jgi:hypothetical protein
MGGGVLMTSLFMYTKFHSFVTLSFQAISISDFLYPTQTLSVLVIHSLYVYLAMYLLTLVLPPIHPYPTLSCPYVDPLVVPALINKYVK